MADFNKAYKLISKYEGGYVNHPNDKGGETYRGIARNLFPQWAGWKIIDKHKKNDNFKNNLYGDTYLNSLVEVFYRKQFWDKLQGDQIDSQLIANELMDIAVNMGMNRATYFLQRALNVSNKKGRLWEDIAVDGVLGNNTINTTNSATERGYSQLIYKLLNVMQGHRYIVLAERNKSQEVFIHGWLKRVQFKGGI